MKKYEHIVYDWKEGGAEEYWDKVLKTFGLIAIEDPTLEGSDMFGYFIMEGKPTLKEFKSMLKREYPDFEEYETEDEAISRLIKEA